MTRLDLRNRLMVLVLAALLIAVSVVGLARSYGVAVAAGGEDEPLLLPGVRDFVADNDSWFWLVMFLLALVVAWLGWRWLRVQLLPTPSLRQLTVAQGDGGRTLVPARAVADAVARDLGDDPDVLATRVRVVGSDRSPALDLRASVTDSARADEVRLRVETRVVGRARAALERVDLTAHVRYRLGDPSQRTIR
jgi:hypothetical protein